MSNEEIIQDQKRAADYDKLKRAANRNGFHIPERPLDPSRLRRAESVANRIMLVIAPYCQSKQEAFEALLAAAYDADVELTSAEERMTHTKEREG